MHQMCWIIDQISVPLQAPSCQRPGNNSLFPTGATQKLLLGCWHYCEHFSNRFKTVIMGKEIITALQECENCFFLYPFRKCDTLWALGHPEGCHVITVGRVRRGWDFIFTPCTWNCSIILALWPCVKIYWAKKWHRDFFLALQHWSWSCVYYGIHNCGAILVGFCLIMSKLPLTMAD